jgi:hypothetical protein
MPSFHVLWIPGAFAGRERAERALRDAARALKLTPRLRRVSVVVRPRPGCDDAHVTWRAVGRRVDARIVVDLGNFLTPAGRRALARSGTTAAMLPARRYSDRAARAAFLHELSHVADHVRRGIDGSVVPPRRWASFNEAWNVWIDGRLCRRGRPGLTRRERLAAFHHTFARRGRARVHVVPVFERLWRAVRLSQRDLLEAVELLVG